MPCDVLLVVGAVLVVPVVVVLVPGLVVCVPIPGLGVTVPVLCAAATPTASAKADDANKIFRIESCSLSECGG